MTWMIYGAYGYTGELLAREAKARGHEPVLAGRNEDKLRAIADELSLEAVALSLEERDRLRATLENVDLVVHAAGPFVHTAAPMMRACLDARTHYTDITGEIPVFEEAFSLSERAEQAGIVMMSGIGFDVVPTDCLAAYVAAQVEDADELEIGISAIGRPSGGTAESALTGLVRGNRVRRDGELLEIPIGYGEREIQFSDGARAVVAIPWGDLVTAWHSTSIPNITTYMSMPPRRIRLLRTGGNVIKSLMAIKPLRNFVKQRITGGQRGPSAKARKRSRSQVWARAAGPSGEAQAWLECGEGYEYTAAVGVRAVEGILEKSPKGAQTPSQVLGADFPLSIEGTRRLDSLDAA